MSIGWKGAAVAFALAAGTAIAWAQMPGAGNGAYPGGRPGYGPGMMYGQGGNYGPWGQRFSKRFAAARFDALRQQLKITDAQSDAWDTYVKAVTDAQQGVWTAMRSMMQPGGMYSLTPDQRFAFMQNIIQLRQKSFEAEKQAADALLPHLTSYQRGQASVLLPGLATTGYGPFGYGMGYGHGWGMMGGFGGGYGPGMMGFGP